MQPAVQAVAVQADATRRSGRAHSGELAGDGADAVLRMRLALADNLFCCCQPALPSECQIIGLVFGRICTCGASSHAGRDDAGKCSGGALGACVQW